VSRSPAFLVLFFCLFGPVACRQSDPASAPAARQAAASAHDDHAQHVAQAPVGGDDHAGHDPHAGHDHHAGQAIPGVAPLPGGSIYHTTASFSDQHGEPLQLASLRSSAVLAAMFYASCTSVCPMLVSQLARIDRDLAPETRARTQVLLVSLDPARDSTEKLQEVAKRHGITDQRWHFVRTGDDSVREIAALLGIRYSALPDGEFSHSPVIALLDREGVLVARMENASADPAALVAAADQVARGAPR
jgi:protein SCO1/2